MNNHTNFPLKCINRVGLLIITLQQFILPINLNSFDVKFGEPLTKKWKLSTVSRRVSSLKPWKSFESKDSFFCANVKSSFKFLGAVIKCQKCSKSEVLGYAKDRMARSKTGWQINTQFVQINVYYKVIKFSVNNLNIHLILVHCISWIIF